MVFFSLATTDDDEEEEQEAPPFSFTMIRQVGLVVAADVDGLEEVQGDEGTPTPNTRHRKNGT